MAVNGGKALVAGVFVIPVSTAVWKRRRAEWQAT
jgi:hypothetical protein